MRPTQPYQLPSEAGRPATQTWPIATTTSSSGLAPEAELPVALGARSAMAGHGSHRPRGPDDRRRCARRSGNVEHELDKVRRQLGQRDTGAERRGHEAAESALAGLRSTSGVRCTDADLKAGQIAPIRRVPSARAAAPMWRSPGGPSRPRGRSSAGPRA